MISDALDQLMGFDIYSVISMKRHWQKIWHFLFIWN